ncbi:unnamed protein product [Amoebophrya sp. A25]|nr:unnamed protein product [Amoebophrya sp. A25]|eukprot:GSA25T00016202001.1
MGDASPPPEKGGRYGLPGIPSYVDRVSQERIYADKIISEEKYLEKCKEIHTGDHKKSLGILKGFEIIKFPTYVEVRKVYNEEEKASKPQFVLKGSEEKAPESRAPKKTVDERIMEARAECNRTAPTYAYKYFSEKHMATKRGGPTAPKKPLSMEELAESAKDLPSLADVLKVPERVPHPMPSIESDVAPEEPVHSRTMLVQNAGTQTPK